MPVFSIIIFQKSRGIKISIMINNFAFDNIGSPVIIIGMHRSGTTMLTKILHDYGLFMGDIHEQNSEAVSFLRVNEKLLREASSGWCDLGYNDERILKPKKKYIDICSAALKTRRFADEYFGELSNEDFKKDFSWGWKDPRNTLTLNIWRELFPNSKIIHIYRNPIDVAASLRDRELKFDRAGKIKWYLNVARNYLKKRIYVRRCPALLDKFKGLELWRLYLNLGLNQKNDILHIKYEDFLDAPLECMQNICLFLKMDFDLEKATRLTCTVNGSRKYAFVESDELKSFYELVRMDKDLRKLGYGEI
jgi:hypothetical protein